MRKRLELWLVCGLTLGVCIAPEVGIRAAGEALSLCARALVPSLFVFFVLSGLLVRLGLAAATEKPLSRICRPLFGVGGSGMTAILLGFVSGYPVGTLCVKTLYQNGALSKTEAERLLAFCNNSGPLFILGTVGTVLLGNPIAGAILYLCHVLSAISVGILFRFYRHSEQPRPCRTAVFHAQTLSTAVGESVRAAVENMLYVCGFTILFSVLIALLDAFLPPNLLLSGLFEMTNACNRIAAQTSPLSAKLPLLSLVLGFGGLSVHLQLRGILSGTDLSAKTCLIGKVLQAILSYIYVFCFLRRFGL